MGNQRPFTKTQKILGLIGSAFFATAFILMIVVENVINKGIDEQIYIEAREMAKEVNTDENGLVSGDMEIYSFVRSFHSFYNDTLCWGRIDKVNISMQVKTAEELIEIIDGMKTEEKDLAKDLSDIKQTAERVVESQERIDLVRLHRLFHDLDIHMNGADFELFNITSYKGE